MNLEHLEKCTERHHKATLAIVEKLAKLPIEFINTCPVIAKKGTRIYMCIPGYTGTWDTDYIDPYVMNGAFSLELKMKYLHVLETGTTLNHSHRLLSLYSSLTNETKEKVRNNFKEITKKSATCKEVTKILAQELKLQFSWELHQLLSSSDMAFERWRYIYESGTSTWFAGYSEIQEALNIRIRELKQ